jgi:hypothetical protein
MVIPCTHAVTIWVVGSQNSTPPISLKNDRALTLPFAATVIFSIRAFAATAALCGRATALELRKSGAIATFTGFGAGLDTFGAAGGAISGAAAIASLVSAFAIRTGLTEFRCATGIRFTDEAVGSLTTFGASA